MVYLICFLIAVASAFTGSLVGMGGGVILIPVLLFLYNYSDAFVWATPQVVVGISLIAMVFTAFSSTVAYYKNERIHYKAGFLFLTGSIPGGILGSWLNQFLNADHFSLYFGVLMILLSLLFLIKRKPVNTVAENKYESAHPSGEVKSGNRYPFVPAFLISCVVGTISGLFGIGGGAIMVPAMMLLLGLPIHIAAATSMFMILFISIISAGTHMVLGHIAWEYVFFFIPGAWIGGTLGAKVNQMIKGITLEWILRIMMIVIGLRLILEGIM